MAEAQFRQSASAGPLFLPVCWSAFVSVVRWALDQRTKTAFCPPLPGSFWMVYILNRKPPNPQHWFLVCKKSILQKWSAKPRWIYKFQASHCGFTLAGSGMYSCRTCPRSRATSPSPCLSEKRCSAAWRFHSSGTRVIFYIDKISVFHSCEGGTNFAKSESRTVKYQSKIIIWEDGKLVKRTCGKGLVWFWKIA